LRADRGAELAGLDDIVGRDCHDLGVGDRDLRVRGRQLEVLQVVLRAEVTSGEHEDQRVVPLQLAQPPPHFGVIGQLVVGEGPARDDIGAHDLVLFLSVAGK
jgi:hypothetical protein